MPDADAVVGHGELDLSLAGPRDRDVDRAAFGRVHHRVADEVVQHLLEVVTVAARKELLVGVVMQTQLPNESLPSTLFPMTWTLASKSST